VPQGECRMIDQRLLAQTGGLAIWPQVDGTLRLDPTRRAQRLWNSAGPKPLAATSLSLPAVRLAKGQ